jgi:hypothetical protein
LQECGCTIGGGDGGEGESFRPPCSSIHHSEEVRKTGGERKWADQINMEVCKTSSWYRNVRSLKANMAMNFAFLAR